jgi:hypothetical protein
MSKARVAIDFDGVLADYRGWQGDEITGSPIAGAREFIKTLLAENYEVIIFSTRKFSVVHQWLAIHDFPLNVVITDRKLPALCYIDDRAYRFEGDWTKAKAAIQMKPWWQA